LNRSLACLLQAPLFRRGQTTERTSHSRAPPATQETRAQLQVSQLPASTVGTSSSTSTGSSATHCSIRYSASFSLLQCRRVPGITSPRPISYHITSYLPFIGIQRHRVERDRKEQRRDQKTIGPFVRNGDQFVISVTARRLTPRLRSEAIQQ
jgi:hypothetical protein